MGEKIMSTNNLAELLQLSQDTVTALLEDGIDPELEFDIEHHVVSDNFDKLEKAAVELVKAGYYVDDAEEFDTEDGQVCYYFAAVSESTIDEEVLAEQTRQVCEIAEAAGVEYDGWGTYLGDDEEDEEDSEEDQGLPH